MMLSLAFTVAYFLTTIIHLVVGALGICFPFGILGVFIPTFSKDLGRDETELMTLHLARMCQVGSLCTGLSLLLLRKRSTYVRANLMLTTNLGAVLYSLGEIFIDKLRADRLGIDVTKVDEYSRSIQFLIGCLDGGSFSTFCLSAVFLLIATVTLWTMKEEKGSTNISKKKV